MNRFVYTLLLWLVLPFVPLKLLWRGVKQPEYKQNWGERFGFYRLKPRLPVIWLHCVSVGETRAAEPLVNMLLAEYPNHQVLITHGTPTGRETSQALFGAKVSSVYLPYDLPLFVSRFLQHFKPVLGVILETELWFNLLHHAKKQHVPVMLVNARLSEKSALGYAKLGGLVKTALNSLAQISAQSEQDAARLTQLGANNVKVLGNIKFDIAPPMSSKELGEQLRVLINPQQHIIFLAASTREGEEAIILDAVKDLELMTIIVPRHPQRFNVVAALLESQNLKYIRRSELTTDTAKLCQLSDNVATQHVKFILGDTMGEMFSYYAACDIALIGGSLLPYGSQNLIEAMASGKPVLIGEHSFNFKQTAEIAVAQCAALRVKGAADIKQALKTLINNPQKQREMAVVGLGLCRESAGATEKNMQLIRSYLN